MSSYSQTTRSYLSTIFGFDLNPSSRNLDFCLLARILNIQFFNKLILASKNPIKSSLNRIVQLYTWIIFIVTPLLANFITYAWALPIYVSPVISAISVLLVVFTLKMVSYQLFHFFESNQAIGVYFNKSKVKILNISF